MECNQFEYEYEWLLVADLCRRVLLAMPCAKVPLVVQRIKLLRETFEDDRAGFVSYDSPGGYLLMSIVARRLGSSELRQALDVVYQAVGDRQKIFSYDCCDYKALASEIVAGLHQIGISDIVFVDK